MNDLAIFTSPREGRPLRAGWGQPDNVLND